MTQPTDRPGIDEIRNLVDRAERHQLTGDEAARLRAGIETLHSHLQYATQDCDGWADDCRSLADQQDQLIEQTVAHQRDAAEQRQRADRAEATLTAARSLATNMRDWDGDNPAIARWATDILAVLDQHSQTTV
ncbi:hypothetical protein ABT034_33655 [Streptomyces sp. NPDC002773]|uniref:hypothetical protein n=1 Tax=Streptomyces sp. NPDC002773 TaxID=3154430 RepID=UPI0033174595